MPPLEWTTNMIRSIPATAGVYQGPVKRPRSADDDFFDAGNVQRALQCKLSVYCVEDDSFMMLENDRLAYECMFKDCKAKFSSLRRHDAHYETSHRNLCSSCGRSFPSYRLLDLHLSEEHDSFFKAMAERTPMYLCLVEGCAEVFRSTGKRHAHLVEVHRYPESFDFSRLSYTRKKAPANRKPKNGKDGPNPRDGDASNARRNSQRASKMDCSSNPFGCCTSGEEAAKKETEERAGTATTGNIVTYSDAENTLVGTTATTTSETTTGQPGLDVQMTVASVRSGNVLCGSRPRVGTDMDVQLVEVRQSRGVVDATDVVGAMRPTSRLNGNRVCKFWGTAGGCRAGGDCKFRHSAAQGSEASRHGIVEASGRRAEDEGATTRNGGRRAARAGVSEAVDTSDVDEIVEGMRQVKLLVPNHLSFGRSARRGKPILR